MIGKYSSALVAVVLFIALAPTAFAAPLKSSSKIVNIRSDRGGQISRYVQRANLYARTGSILRFSGPCDSACTLFLSVPKRKLCIKKGASFGFHLPYGSSDAANALAARYILKKYPSWVRSWIRANGGLKARIERMDYAYARRFMRPCLGNK